MGSTNGSTANTIAGGGSTFERISTDLMTVNSSLASLLKLSSIDSSQHVLFSVVIASLQSAFAQLL